LTLCASVSKFKTAQEDFQRKLKAAEDVMAANGPLVKLDAEIAEKEEELERLRKTAWETRIHVLKDS
jgi:hypothetical protein